MKMQLEDIAALLSGMTIVINDCSLQFVVGVPTSREDDEPEDAVGHGMGFLAPLEGDEEEFEGDEEELEEPVARCRKSAVSRKRRR